MSDISLTASMRSNLLSLQNTQSFMDATQERLSTGKSINSALDNPSSYYTSQSLTNRASDLNLLLDSMGQGISTIKAANEGIESITEFVEQAKAVANQARDEANTIAYSTGSYNSSEITDATTFTLSLTYDGETQTVEVTSPANQASGDAMAGAIQTAMEGVNFGTPPTALGGENFELSYANGVFSLSSANGEELKMSFSVGGANMNATAGNNTRVDAVNRFNDILDQIDRLAQDSGYKGINLLGGTDQTLTVIFNEDRSSNLVIQGVDASTKGLNISRATNWGNNADIDASITQVEDAINELRNIASEFGNNYSVVQTREDFTDSLINVLEEGSDKLTLADMNEESANMLSLQTRQQLAINSLSLSSQGSQSVLALFG